VNRSGEGQGKPPAVTIIVEEPMWRVDPSLIRTVRQAARLALKVEPAVGRKQHYATVSILLADNRRLKRLNRAFRNKPKPTNVLAFPAVPELSPHIGDIALAYGVLRDESAAQNKSLAAHAAHLAIHGILHLLGYDHEQPEDAKAMENLEILLLGKIGISDPYAPVPVPRRVKQPKLAACPRIPAR
jgi:probable rRNA maturation factor